MSGVPGVRRSAGARSAPGLAALLVALALVAWDGGSGSGSAVVAAGATPDTAVRAATPGRHGAASGPVVVGSKAFPESWILGEALARLARDSGHAAEHRRSLGGTEIVYQALRSGQVDIYAEYTGTIAEVLLHRPGATLADMRASLAAERIGVGEPLGFNDSYALAVTRATSERLGLRTLSDLVSHPELELGLTHEFLGRADGWPSLARHYALRPRSVRGIQHELAYTALASGAIDVTDIYTTDAQIARLDLVTLQDDRKFFPRYDAVLLYRLDLERRAPGALRAMRRLEGAIDEPRMIRANARVVIENATVEAAADTLLAERLLAGSEATRGPSLVSRVLRHLGEHIRLVAFSLVAAIVVGVPMGIAAARLPALAGPLLAVSGLLQTIPSLALLAFLIPVMGIGAKPALVTLFLYGLLPIVRNTHTGLATISPSLLESAEALGLSRRARLLSVELPLASPAILAGIKTSAVINVGTATIAALIGAGGLGEPILAGIQLRRNDLILEGAIPAAVLALVVQWLFDVLEPRIVPKGLRIGAARADE